MATEVLCRVVPGGLMTSNEAEAEKLEDLIGKEVKATITRPRNLLFHKKYMALLRVTLPMSKLDLNFQQWRHLVSVGAGHCDWLPRFKTRPLPEGVLEFLMERVGDEQLRQDLYVELAKALQAEVVAVPKSISFAAMDDIEFEELYSNAIHFICENYVDDDPEHIRQVVEFIS